MNRFTIAISLLIAILPATITAQAQTAQTAPPVPAVAAHGSYSVADTSIGDLLDNPATRAIVARHLPALVTDPRTGLARGMTLKMVQQYAGDSITDAKLTAIDEDLRALADAGKKPAP